MHTVIKLEYDAKEPGVSNNGEKEAWVYTLFHYKYK
jgi:hypothetical protein